MEGSRAAKLRSPHKTGSLRDLLGASSSEDEQEYEYSLESAEDLELCKNSEQRSNIADGHHAQHSSSAAAEAVAKAKQWALESSDFAISSDDGSAGREACEEQHGEHRTESCLRTRRRSRRSVEELPSERDILQSLSNIEEKWLRKKNSLELDINSSYSSFESSFSSRSSRPCSPTSPKLPRAISPKRRDAPKAQELSALPTNRIAFAVLFGCLLCAQYTFFASVVMKRLSSDTRL